MSEADNVWRIALDGREYEVELQHGTFTGSRKIKVDGSLIEQSRKFFDTGSVHDFELSGHPARIEIRVKYSGLAHASSLHVDNRYVEPLRK